MLEALRKGAGSWIAKIFIGLLVLSFAVWGINDIFTGQSSTSLATVGDQKVTEYQFQEVFQRELRQLSQRLQQQVSVDQARQLGVDRQVLQRLISQAALDDQVASFTLAVPDQAIADRIVKDRLFQNAQGKFDRLRFEQVLANNGFNEQTYVAVERQNILRAEIAGIVDRGVTIPIEMIKAIHRQQNEARTAEYFVVPASKAGKIAEPTDAEQNEYYDANKRRFTAPEFRTLSILRLDPSDLAKGIDISEENLKKAFEDRKDGYVTPERREILQMAFTSTEEAQKAYDRISSGTDFVDIAKERKLTEVDYVLGTVTRAALPDKAIAQAAFELAEGAVSPPVSGKLATVVLKVLKIEPEDRKTFADVKADLQNQLSLEQAQEEVANMHDTVEDARAGGSTLAEISEKLNLPLINVDTIDRNGLGADGKAVKDIPATTEVLRVAFESDVGVENDPIDTANEGYAWVDVDEVTPEAVRPFDEVAAEIKTLWVSEKRRDALFKFAQGLVDQGRDGKTMAELAAATGETVQTTEAMRRRDVSDVFSATAISNLFQQKDGGWTLAPIGKGDGMLIMRVASVTAPEFPKDTAEVKSLSQQLDRGLGEDLLQQYLNGLQETLGVTVNAEIWERLRGSGT